MRFLLERELITRIARPPVLMIDDGFLGGVKFFEDQVLGGFEVVWRVVEDCVVIGVEGVVVDESVVRVEVGLLVVLFFADLWCSLNFLIFNDCVTDFDLSDLFRTKIVIKKTKLRHTFIVTWTFFLSI